MEKAAHREGEGGGYTLDCGRRRRAGHRSLYSCWAQVVAVGRVTGYAPTPAPSYQVWGNTNTKEEMGQGVGGGGKIAEFCVELLVWWRPVTPKYPPRTRTRRQHPAVVELTKRQAANSVKGTRATQQKTS